MKIHCIQHVPFEDLAAIKNWISDRGHKITYTRIFEGDPFPNPEEFDLLIMMGGPMSVNEEDHFPWLVQEKQLIREAFSKRKKILGICLGAQMIASAFGQKVYPNKFKEIGWFPVNITTRAMNHPYFNMFPPECMVFHWHGETFDLPEGAVLIGSSEACRHQGFILADRIVGFQFHIEETQESLKSIDDHCRHELIPGPYIQTEEYFLHRISFCDKANALLFRFLDAFSSDLS